MSREMPLGGHDTTGPWNDADDYDAGAYDERDESVLDTLIALPAVTWRAVVGTVALLSAALLRLPGLDRFAMSAAEADLALAAHNLVRGESLPSHLHGAPFVVDWAALFLFAGGSMESVARVATAVAGLVAIVMLLGLGRWVDGRSAVLAALLAALSPTLIAASRRVDGGILLVTLSLVVNASALAATARPGIAWPAVAGAATSALVLTGPLGIPAALLAWLAVLLLLRESRRPDREQVLAGLASAVATLVLLSTAFLTRPGSFAASIGELLAGLGNDHLAEAGTRFWMPAFNLILNEPLLLTLALVATVASERRRLVRALGIWTVAAFVVVSLLGDVGAPGFALVTLPFVLLAGVGGAHLVERLPWWQLRRGPGTLFVVAALLAATAAISLFGLIANGVSGDTGEWLLRFALIVIVVLLPLSMALSTLGARLRGDRLVLTLLAALVFLSGLTLRSSVLAASERPNELGDPLAAGATGADIPIVVGILDRLSRDLTANQRSSQDPAGGHGLVIAIDERIAQPFRWYFRDYPNARVFDPDTTPVPFGTQVVLLDANRDVRAVAPGYVGQPYLYAELLPEIYRAPDWGGLLSDVVDLDGWRRFAEFFVDRQPLVPPAERQFQLLATGEVAELLYQNAGPFGLDDRAGAGSAQGQLNRPRGVAVAADGSVYVVDARNSRVQKYAPNGDFELAFGSEGSGPGQFGRFATAGGGGANGIALGDDGTVYVADTWNHRVQAFTPDGQFLRQWGTFFDAADDPAASTGRPGEFYGPRGLAFHGGLLYVTDTGNERVQVFQADGRFVRMFGAPGSEVGQLLEPVGIAVAPDGTVLVADSHNARVARFSAEGSPLDPLLVSAWQELRFFEPYVAVGPDGSTYLTTSQTGSVLRLSPQGGETVEIGAGALQQPFGIAVSPDGSTLFVTDGQLHAVVRVPLPPS